MSARVLVTVASCVLCLGAASGAALSALGDCGQPVSNGAAPTASDCLFILRSAVGSADCVPECVCDTNGLGGVNATDALLCLARAVGQPVPLDCPCAAPSASLTVTANPSPARPGTRIDVQVAVTNVADTALLGVIVELELPAGVGDFSVSEPRGADATCVGTLVSSTCSAGETVRWSVGVLEPGELAVLSIAPPIENDPAPSDGSRLTFAVNAFASGLSVAAGNASVSVDSTRTLDLVLDEDRDPVAAGGLLRYRLGFGNRGSASSSSTILRMPVPAGTSFVRASDGGALGGDAIVEWSLGTLVGGASGVRELLVEVDASAPVPGEILAGATLENGAGELVDVAALTAVGAQQPLRVAMTMVPDPAEPGDLVTGTVTVTNKGSQALSDLTVEVVLPQGMSDFFLIATSGAPAQCIGVLNAGTCSAGETLRWSLTQLEPGAGVTLTMPPTIGASRPAGTVVSFEARARGGGGNAAARRSVRVAAGRLFDLAVEDDAEPVSPGAELRYVLSYGNASSTAATDTVLRAELPANVSFLGAGDGGIFDGDNLIEWPLGTIDPGASGTREILASVDAMANDGDVLGIAAEIKSPDGPATYASADTRVRGRKPLVLSVESNTDPSPPGDTVATILTVANQGPEALDGVEVELLLPQETGEFYRVATSGAPSSCEGTFVANTCEAGERLVFAVGALPAGAGVTLFAPPRVDAAVAPGSVMTFSARARANGGENAALNRAVRVGGSGVRLDLSLDDYDGDPALTGGAVVYRLAYGNPGQGISEAVLLRLRLPTGATFVAASDGGTLVDQADGEFVEWSIGPVGPGDSGSRDCTITLPSTLDAGSVVRAEATLEDAGGLRTRAAADTRIEQDVPIVLTLEAGPEPAQPGETVQTTLTLTNTGPSPLSGVEAELLLPRETLDFYAVGISGAPAVCAGPLTSGTCSAEERVVWSVGTLPAGSGVTLTAPPGLRNATEPGAVVSYEARARSDDGINTAVRTSTRVKSSRILDLAVDDGGGDPTAAGELLTYTLNFGNRAGVPLPGAGLVAALPVGTTFVAASDGGVLGADGTVTWSLGTLAPGEVGTRELDVAYDDGLADGSVVRATALLDATEATRTRAGADTRVENDSPLSLSLALSPEEAPAATSVDAALVVRNEGAVSLSDVRVEVLLPGEMASFPLGAASGAAAACEGTFTASSCAAGERLVFSVGVLAAGAQALLGFPPAAASGTSAGSQMVFEARAYAAESSPVAVRDTVRVTTP